MINDSEKILKIIDDLQGDNRLIASPKACIGIAKIREIVEASNAEKPNSPDHIAEARKKDLIDRQAVLKLFATHDGKHLYKAICELPSAQPDYTEMKQEFLRMASYVDMLLECSDEQKETLIGFISRLAEFMPWTERD